MNRVSFFLGAFCILLNYPPTITINVSQAFLLLASCCNPFIFQHVTRKYIFKQLCFIILCLIEVKHNELNRINPKVIEPPEPWLFRNHLTDFSEIILFLSSLAASSFSLKSTEIIRKTLDVNYGRESKWHYSSFLTCLPSSVFLLYFIPQGPFPYFFLPTFHWKK